MNDNQNPLPIIPFKPQNGQSVTTAANQEELITKAEQIIAPKKSKTKIILTTLIAFLFLGAIGGTVYLVQQNQDIREQAQVYPPVGCKNQGESGCNQNGCCDNTNVCHNDSCITCGSITDASTCFTHTKCTWINGSCQPNSTPPSGNCTPIVQGGGGALCGNGTSASVSVTATLPDTCTDGLTSELKLSFNSMTAECAGTQYANDCSVTCGNAGSTAYITFPAGSMAGATETLSASCNVPNNCGGCQVDIVGSGVNAGERMNNSSGCNGPTPTTPKTNTPTPTIPSFQPKCPEDILCSEGSYACTGEDGCPSCCAINCECVIIKVYNTSWRQFPTKDLTSIKPGDTIIFTAQGQTTQGTIDKARFKINNGNYQETSRKKTGTQEYYLQYTIPDDATNVNVSAQVHLVETESWY